MSACTPAESAVDNSSAAEREAGWKLYLRFAIEAASEDEARIILNRALTRLKPELPLRGEPVIHPRHRRNPDDIWVAELTPDLPQQADFDPDDAKTRCRWVQGHFPMDVYWSLPQNTPCEAKAEWPPDIWQRQPGRDDVLLYPKVQAVMIYCSK
jgi:hypothetical protein